jgi:hypothetical protein
MNLSLIEAQKIQAQMPGHQLYSPQVQSIIDMNNQNIRLSSAQEAERKATTYLVKQHGTIAARDAEYAKKTGYLDPALKSAGAVIGSASDAASAFGKIKTPKLQNRTSYPEGHN